MPECVESYMRGVFRTSVACGRCSHQCQFASLHEHSTRFIATTRQSAPLRRIGTFGLAVVAACAFSLGIAGKVLTFRTRAWLSFAPSTCRMPLGRSQGIPRADPGGRVGPGFDIA